ncbi:hypothetical protein RhiirA5_353429 [Rhizophagus irregularis]|nr:hypothetical protein GLOIN_2v1697129 [Rhizophagus irregularis DAOM 181602=DAOM 197198]EXX79205.1 hypothetical protein RirG_007820 [Rhizophagus irregularis DAOM 197198w]PKC12067.1 hypothetical protein RhiirA5_353429 [Rhizophagus irregularis]EXX79206.1 hypothetical protein RirG_007820 [Rhizophagus irregularis DAOM 197198w]PKC68846.1 hypothetical protein RhiirA1_416412 [Rhizophagus irregularis]PKK62072.1 hypothetical protein RhiirC2_760019 [Rhizophagus irregularis]|eukprot:XP_025169178.1 hypothetical protein GLOIN_2v1697129 [Rhizophagus irregularis DAOM 181602=DAOM 197198]
MKSFKIMVMLFVIALVALINLTDAVPLPNDPSTGEMELLLVEKPTIIYVKRDLPTGSASDPDIIAPPSPEYNNGSQLKRLAIPIGVVCGVILGSIVLYLVWKWCFKSSEK